MSRPDDFDIIDERDEGAKGSSTRLWVWLIGTLILLFFGFAVGLAFSRISNRLADVTSTPVGIAGPGTTSTPNAAATDGAATDLANGTPANADGSASPEPPTPSAATPSPTATATATPTTPPVICANQPDPAFPTQSVQAWLGCATGNAPIVWAAYEPFQQGMMLWRSDTDKAYYFVDTGRWAPIDERWDGQPMRSRGAPPAGLVEPARGFGYVWSIRDDIFAQLGWARAEEKGFCARVQEFEDGFLLQSEAVASCTADNLYNQATSGAWTPLQVAARRSDGQWQPIRQVDQAVAGLADGAVNSTISQTTSAATTPAAPANQTAAGTRGTVLAGPAPNALTIDGNFSEWPRQWQPLTAVVYGRDAYDGQGDLYGLFQVAWSSQGLVFAVRVADDTYRAGPSGTDMWQGDALEIHFDRELQRDQANPTANEDDYQIGVSFGPNLVEFRAYRWLPFAVEGPLQLAGAVVSLGDGASQRGYNSEFVVPWSALQVSPGQVGPGAEFGFNLSLSDNDSGIDAQQTLISLAPQRTTHDNPTQWMRLQLAP